MDKLQKRHYLNQTPYQNRAREYKHAKWETEQGIISVDPGWVSMQNGIEESKQELGEQRWQNGEASEEAWRWHAMINIAL